MLFAATWGKNMRKSEWRREKAKDQGSQEADAFKREESKCFLLRGVRPGGVSDARSSQAEVATGRAAAPRATGTKSVIVLQAKQVQPAVHDSSKSSTK